MGFSLNKSQLEAVRHQDGPLLVVAGAGTGKTSVIVERAAKLIEDGVCSKQELLILTFTEKAAQELLDRVGERLNESYGVELAIHTFNAFGQLLLQEFAIDIGLSSNLKLVGDDGKVVFLREHLDELGLDYFAPVSRPDGQLSTIADYFSELKQQLIKPENYLEFAEQLPGSDDAEKLERKKHLELATAYGRYIEAMRTRNTIDYDDQIYLAVELLEKRPNILKTLRQRYRYTMVDEFQDTNPMQSRLIDLIAGVTDIPLHSAETVSVRSRESQASRINDTAKREAQDSKPKMYSKTAESRALHGSRPSGECNVMVVGDDDQAIYGWRGATLANILEFTKRYKGAREITLIDNYRSTQDILDSAWGIIQNNNPDRLEFKNNLNKRLKAKRGRGKKPVAYRFDSLESELLWVAEDITKRLKNNQDPGSIAVLARSKRGVARIHEVLDATGTNHVVAGLGEDLYKQPVVLMMVDALKAVWDPGDSAALYHTLVSRLFRCPAAIVSAGSHKARSERRPLIEVLAESDDKVIKSALALIDKWRGQVNDLPVKAMSYRIITDSGFKDGFFGAAANDAQIAHEAQALGQWFASLNDFERIAITPSTYSYLENFPVLRAEGEMLSDDTLSLSGVMPSVMTIHKAKGLEWQTVYLIDCSESSFPHLSGGKSLKVPDELKLVSDADARLAEERRLMYVATTRARDELIITYAERHQSPTTRKPSRFIEEMSLSVSAAAAPANNGEMINDHDKSNQMTEVSPPPSMLEGDNLVLNASQAEDYLVCPLNFYYKHILGIPEQPGPQTAVGSLFHDLIESINDAKKNGQPLPHKASLLDSLKTSWPITGYSSQMQRERALKLGIKSFDALYDRLASEPVPVAVETPFRVHIPSSRLILKGRIDAVMPAGQGIEIHDYKTSAAVTTPEQAKSKTTSSQQLTMYAVAWRIMNDEVPAYVSLDYVQTGQIGRVKKQAKSLDTMEGKLADIAEAILAGKYPKGHDHEFCLHP